MRRMWILAIAAIALSCRSSAERACVSSLPSRPVEAAAVPPEARGDSMLPAPAAEAAEPTLAALLVDPALIGVWHTTPSAPAEAGAYLVQRDGTYERRAAGVSHALQERGYAIGLVIGECAAADLPPAGCACRTFAGVPHWHLSADPHTYL